MKLVSALALTAVLAGTASAEPDSPKSENTALALSLGGTLASAGLMAAGLVRGDDKTGMLLFDAGLLSSLVTPSLGHFYSGKILTPGLGMRAAGAAVAVVGVTQALGCLSFGDDDPQCGFVDGGGAALLVGGGLAAAGVIYDIATAPKAARTYNEHHLQLVPSSPGANVGLSLTGQF